MRKQCTTHGSNIIEKVQQSGTSSDFNTPAITCPNINHSQLESNSKRSSTDAYTSQWNALKQNRAEKRQLVIRGVLIIQSCKCRSPWRTPASQRVSERTCVLMADVHRHWAAYGGWLIFTDRAALCWRKWHFQRLTWLRFTHINEPQRRPFNSQTASKDINKKIHYRNKHSNQKTSMRWALTD